MLLSSNGTRTIISPIIDGGWNPSGSTKYRCEARIKTHSLNRLQKSLMEAIFNSELTLCLMVDCEFGNES